jgi:ATP-dependent DNA helicase RecG
MATKDPKALLDRLLQEATETPWLEFKENNCDPNVIGPCVAACSNAAILAGKDRAFIVFGIQDQTKAKVGTTIRLNNHKVGGDQFTNWISRQIAPRLQMEYLDFADNGKDFSILCVEQTYDRPVAFEQVEYIRIGTSVKKLKDYPEHAKSLWLATAKHKFEEAIALPHQSADQILEKLDTPTYYSLSQEEQPKSNSETIRKFLSRGFILDDMEGGFDITNLGAILFARDITLFPTISTKSIRVIKYIGNDKSRSEKETVGTKGYAVGFSGLIRFVLGKLPSFESYKSGVRSGSTPVYPEVAIREIISNALIHQDFTITGAGPIVEIYDDRVEVTNPGNSLIEPDRIIDERKSRNEKMAVTMRELGLCEERGGGIDKAIIEIEEMSLPAPLFLQSATSMRVAIFGPKQFSALSKQDKLWACYCHCVVHWIKHDYMNNSTLRKRFSLGDDDYQAVSAVISDARKAGRIIPAEADQGRKNARYVPYWVG